MFCLASNGYAAVTLTDAGASTPSAGASGITQADASGTLPYWLASADRSQGQSFTTPGSHSDTYTLNSFSMKTTASADGENHDKGASYANAFLTGIWNVQICRFDNANSGGFGERTDGPTHSADYLANTVGVSTNGAAGSTKLVFLNIPNIGAGFTNGDWISFNFTGAEAIHLAGGYTYSFSFGQNNGYSSCADIVSGTGDTYAGGIDFNAYGGTAFNDNYVHDTTSADRTFVANLTIVPIVGPPVVNPTTISPSNVYVGMTATLNATYSGTAPFSSFVWQQNGGAGFTNLPGSTTNTYLLNTTGMTPGTYQERLVVTDASGTTTNTPASMVLNAASVPGGTVAFSPSATVTAGYVVTMSASLTGNAPSGGYQWQFSDNATFTNNISGANSSTYTIYNTTTANSGYYRLAATNMVGAGATAFAQLTVTPLTDVQILNIGATVPVASGSDIAQLSSVGNQKFPSGGLNYYSDNGGDKCAQTFLTGANPSGYLLSSLSIQWGSIEGGHGLANPYTLRIYSVSGATATLLQTYTNNNPADAMAVGQWTKWIGLSNVLAPNATYAYSIHARSEGGTQGGGYMQVGNASGDPYAGGAAALIPAAGGAINFGTSADDATFLINLATLTSSVATNPTNITSSVSGSTLSLSWPSDHLGWFLQTQTNSLSLGLKTNWFDVPGSAALTNTSSTIDTTSPTVFFRLRSP